MKRFIISLFLLLGLLLPSVCLAKISAEDLSIGKIYIGQSMREVLDIYGDPVKILKTPGSLTYVKFIFSDGESDIQVVFKDEKVSYASITNGSKFLTSKNIGIGNSEDDLLSVYGIPDKVSESPDYPGKKIWIKNFIYYTSDSNLLDFAIANNVIIYISIN